MGGLVSRGGLRSRLQLGVLEDRCTPSSTVIGDPSPRVAAFVVNDGAAQRSEIYSLQIDFNEPINLAGSPADFIKVYRVTNGGYAPYNPIGHTMTATTLPNGNTSVRCVGPSGTDAIIIDGDFKIVLTPGRMSQNMGSDGSNELLGSFHSLFGDTNGDRAVDFSDYVAFRNSFGLTSSDADFAAFLDANGDGVLSQPDFIAFRNNFGSIL